MNTYKITYKVGTNYSNLPTTIEADSYRTNGRFIDFIRHGNLVTSSTATTLHRIAAESVVHIELEKEGAEDDDA